MKIPNAESAIVDMDKLRDYILNPAHRVGRHKARLFAALLGIGLEDANEFHSVLLTVVQTHDAVIGELDQHGQRYRLDFVLNWHGRRALIRTAWNVRPHEDFPRLITCYPLEEKN